AFRRALRRRLFWHVYRQRDSAIVAETGSTLLLQGHGHDQGAIFLRAPQYGGLQGRQQAVAAELLDNYRQLCHGRALLYVLSSQRSQCEFAGGDCADQNWRRQRCRYFAGICRSASNAASEEPPSAAAVRARILADHYQKGSGTAGNEP